MPDVLFEQQLDVLAEKAHIGIARDDIPRAMKKLSRLHERLMKRLTDDTEPDICPICLVPTPSHARTILVGQMMCRHTICNDCAREYEKRDKSTCPICREEFIGMVRQADVR